jgi:hypothetical protein
MDWKQVVLQNLKFDDAAGSFTALFAPFNVVDKQGDLTLPGAFGEQRVIISAYGHGSWSGELPVGKGRIFENAEGGVVEGQFFLDTDMGKQTYLTVKNLGDLQEFSYALPEVDYEMREQDGERIRVLKRIKVNEVSPVLLGAGMNTHLLDIKSDDGKSIQLVVQLEAVASDARKAIDRLKSLAELRAADGRRPGPETMKRAAATKQALEKLSIEIGRLETGASVPGKAGEDYSMLAESIRFALLTTARR